MRRRPRGHRYWRNLALFAGGTLLVAAAVLALLWSYRSATHFVHPPRTQRPPSDTPARYGVAYQELQLLTADRLHLAAWYTPPQNGTVILVAHGYAAARSARMVALFAQHGYGVLAWDFRAHGESEGTLCTMGYDERQDVEAALDFALAQPGVVHVAAWGGSMGGVAIIEAAAERPEIAAVVVDSVFPTLEEVMNRVIPLVTLRPLVRFFAEQETGVRIVALRPVAQIGHLSPRPVFIIQGLADELIPSDSAQRLYDAAGEPRTLWVAPNVGHLGMYNALPEEYERRVIGFFDAALEGK
jgi:fermentation-respiration switch protein FrsA (DUF1100 family)